ncbi:4'-phosphopantetheinyl transferase family protein [Butyrivibrio sp. AE2032]|uniref:4'-phosphopantetheinyl transferase family protein n=1 Tax=Butyrivibrio sp. AE2032 TaxID=1458463 RepID=UPI000550818C|nr:4'-phosphopantetheinyl transferase superfamily protein [Butyrivibrio sp. AE2032]
MSITNQLYLLDVSVLTDEKSFRAWYDRMDETRKNKIDTFKPEKSKRLSLGAGILLYKALEEAGIKDYELCYKGREKPYIKGHEDVFFNISHSGDLVALGISDKEIGVDIEKCRVFKDTLINYVYNDVDLSFASNLPIEWAYTRLWTLKESVMKHSGMGIALVPKQIEIYSEAGEVRARTKDYDCEKLRFSSHIIGDYQLSVCSEYPQGAFSEVRFINIT